MLIDRTVVRRTKVKDQEFYYIVTSADEDRESQERTIKCFREYLDCIEGARKMGVIYGTGVYIPGEIKHSPAFEEAYEMRGKL